MFYRHEGGWPQVRTFTAGEPSSLVWDNSPGTLSSSSRWWRSASFHTLLPVTCDHGQGRLSLSEKCQEGWWDWTWRCVPEPVSPGPSRDAWLGKWLQALYGKSWNLRKMPKAFRNEQTTICLRRLLGKMGNVRYLKERKRNKMQKLWIICMKVSGMSVMN